MISASNKFQARKLSTQNFLFIRTALVMKAFRKLDTDGSGELTIDDLQGVFNVARHPQVLSGAITEKQALQGFLNSFESFDGEGNKDGVITFTEFEDYFSGVSSDIDNDDYFALMMCQSWGITE